MTPIEIWYVMNNKMQLIDRDWPEDGLERVQRCPVCLSSKRKLLYNTLQDRIFSCSPGKWTLYSCDDCGSAYLDPRPNLKTISLAYKQYFTHDEIISFSSLSLFRKMRRVIADVYRNYHYGIQPSTLGYLVHIFLSCVPGARNKIDIGMRDLPRVKQGQTLLDVGCGNGMFLSRAEMVGWTVTGIDIDPDAVKIARDNGLNVKVGSIIDIKVVEQQFDVITLSHVIEHVHDPIDLLLECYALLKPGGYLWLQTPNIASQGHRLYGEDWRGLEPPRHLTLFSLNAMKQAILRVGFTKFEEQKYRPLCAELFNSSMAIKQARLATEKLDTISLNEIKKYEKIALSTPIYREFITIKAWKTK